jgi:hypothetical protein
MCISCFNKRKRQSDVSFVNRTRGDGKVAIETWFNERARSERTRLDKILDVQRAQINNSSGFDSRVEITNGSAQSEKEEEGEKTEGVLSFLEFANQKQK